MWNYDYDGDDDAKKTSEIDIKQEYKHFDIVKKITKNSNLKKTNQYNRRPIFSQDLDHRPIVFIRFNPEGSTDANGDNVGSCWNSKKMV